jgi:hypothetical protein
MGVGYKSVGHHPGGNQCVERHQRTSKRTLNAVEKALETRIRRQGKRDFANQESW